MAKQLYLCSLAELKLDLQRFHNKNDIKPWLLEKLREIAGLQIVIERSDTSKIVFKCKNNAKKEIVEAKTSNCKVASRRQITCPFRIRANFSQRSQWWALVVINDTHDHEIPGKGIPVSPASGEQGHTVNSGNSSSSSMETINQNTRKIDTMEIDSLNNNMNNNINNINNINNNNIHNINNNINSNNNVRNIDHVSNVSYSPNGVNHIPINNNHNVNYSSHNSPININHSSNHNATISHINAVSHSRYFESPTDNPAFVHNILNSDDPVSSSSHSTKSSSSDVFSLIGSSTTLNSTMLSSHTTPRDNNNSIFLNGLDESFSPSNAILNSSPKRKRPSGSLPGFKSKRVSDIPKSSPKIKLLSLSEMVMLASSTAGTRSNNSVSNSNASTSTKRAKQMDDVTLMMRNEINSIIQRHLINNKGLKRDQKLAVLDSLMSQLVVDHELLNKQLLNPFENSHSTKNAHSVDHSLVKNRELDQVLLLLNLNHLSLKKSAFSNWLNNPNQVHTVGGNPSANLIPLSPLLNDSDTEYNSSNTASLNNNSIDTLTHLPPNITPTNVMSVVNSHSLSNFSNFVTPSQVLQIQNQNQQLPSFNSIQHKLPLSPGGSGGVTSSSGVSSALIPPISNSIPSTTLNPSHLLKSNTKSLNFNSGQPSSFLTEAKNNSYFTSQLFSSSHTYSGGLGQFSTSSLLSGLSIPTAQSTSANNNNNINNTSLAFGSSNILTNIGSGSNRDNLSVGNTSNLLSLGILNNVGNFSESGW